MWPWPDPRSRSRSQSFWTSENCRKLHFSRPISSTILAWSSKLMVDRDSQLVGARFSNFLLRKLAHEFKLCGMSNTRIWNGHISLLLEAAVTWSDALVVLYVLRMLIWPWSDPRSRSRSLTFWSSANCTFLRWHHQNSLPFISALAESRSLWLWLHEGCNKPSPPACTAKPRMLAAMTVSPFAGLSG